MNKRPFIERLREAYEDSFREDEDLDILHLVYDRVNKILKEVDKYMTDPDQLYTTSEYNFQHGRMEACNEVMRVFENNEDYDYCEENPADG